MFGSPNIIGEISPIDVGGHDYMVNLGASGAFAVTEDKVNAYSFGDYKRNMKGVTLFASRSNAAYGNSSTIQPNSLRAFVLIKI